METFNRSLGTSVRSDVKLLAMEAFQHQQGMSPELKRFISPEFVEKSVRDTEYTILYLSNAISVSSPKLFENYIEWFILLMESIALPIKYLKGSIESIFVVMKRHYAKNDIDIIEKYIMVAYQTFEHHSKVEASTQTGEHYLKPYRDQYIDFLLHGNRNKANELIQELISRDVLITDIYMEIFHESQREIGKLWQINKITIAEEHYCTAATQLIMGQLYPKIFETPKNDLVFIGACVGGELHELGVRMVSDFLELAGWNTYYLGANTPVKSILETIVNKSANLIGISVTITFHMDEVIQLIEMIRADMRCKSVKIMVGGYPFIVDDQLWKTVGADGYAKNARDAVKVADKLVSEVTYEYE